MSFGVLSGTACDEDGHICTYDLCAGGVCRHPDKCPLVQTCCPNGECCDTACEECLDNGSLSGGAITVDPAPVCVGATITFTVSGVTDNGAIKRVDCSAKTLIPAVTPTYTWTITKPDASEVTGSGPVATVLASDSGAYSATVTATTARECAAPPIALPREGDPPVTAEAIEVDLDVDSNNDNGIGLPDRSSAEDAIETTGPGKLLCVNDDDDDNNGVPDRDQEPPPVGDNDLVPMVAELKQSAPAMSQWQLVYDAAIVQVYENDRATIVSTGQIFNMPLAPNPKKFWIEGIAPSTGGPTSISFNVDLDGDGTFDCSDSVLATVIRAKLEPVTSGTNPIPFNPTIVAPMTPLLLDNGALFWDANSFELTTLQPSIDLTTLPVTWTFNTTSGFLNPTAQVVVAPDRQSARLEIPFPSFGNLGAGRMEFRLGGEVCAQVDTLIKNVQPDLEPGDVRFQVKAHLCFDGAGASTTRTTAEVRAIMSDVTKVLSQCGIIVTLSQVVTTQVSPGHLDIDSTSLFELPWLFSTDEDDINIDVYFVNTIDFTQQLGCGATSGVTLSPANTGIAIESGIAIPDTACDGNGIGQEIVRTLAHEITHYLLNKVDGNLDHVTGQSANLMSPGASETKRDLSEAQCIELRSNFGVD